MSDCHHSEGEISKATAHSHPPTSTYRGELRVGNNQAAVTTTAHTVRSLSGGRQGALLHVLRLAPAAPYPRPTRVYYVRNPGVLGRCVDPARYPRRRYMYRACVRVRVAAQSHERVSPALQVMRGCRGGS